MACIHLLHAASFALLAANASSDTTLTQGAMLAGPIRRLYQSLITASLNLPPSCFPLTPLLPLSPGEPRRSGHSLKSCLLPGDMCFDESPRQRELTAGYSVM
ncbi:hypothetical protein CgunFtcFv8_009040 [Champsocephalus gunnari]|uniref:Secreted protein n=1 Tax=Champsocephalus gunnari TaxID=52237 RepID=A0AAN8D652_CHAGU|nr:hypothetical protein CgunFtcFv8_009040 [Champsocephalus gunnari]